MIHRRKNDLGEIGISDRVIRRIVIETMEGCEGVMGLTGRGLRGLLRSWRGGRGIQIQPGSRPDAIAVTLHIRVGFGIKITEVGRELAARVSRAVSAQTGFEVEAVNVNVDAISVDEREEEDER